jgi:hypothetical protein
MHCKCINSSKAKVMLPLYLTKNHAMKTYGGMEVQFHAVLTLVLDGGEWSASCPSPFTPGERGPHYPLDRRLGGPRAGLNVVAKRRIFAPCQELNPSHPACSIITIQT